MSIYQSAVDRVRRGGVLRGLAVAVAASGLGAGVLAAPAAALPTIPDASANYSFTTLDNQADPTFNQLLGINNHGLIAGYFGSGATGHPNKGYRLSAPYGQAQYVNENFPGSEQTQVTGLNNHGVTVGFWVDAAGNNFGFYASNGRFHTVAFPTTDLGTPSVQQLLGVNDKGVAVGFYTDANGKNHGFTYNIRTKKFHRVLVPGDVNVTASGINNHGDITGFADPGTSNTPESFLKQSNGNLIRLNVPPQAGTTALGVNNGDEVVGSYLDAAGNSHGFTWTPGGGFQSVEDPNGPTSTVVNGVNDRGSLVGFYTDAAGNTDGMLAVPHS